MDNFVFNIEKKLDVLGKIEELGISRNVVCKIKPEKLDKIYELKQQDYYCKIESKLLKSDKLFNVFNSDNEVLKNAYTFLFTETRYNEGGSVVCKNIENYNDDKVILLCKINEEYEKNQSNNYYRSPKFREQQLMEFSLEHDIQEPLTNDEICNMFISLRKLNELHAVNKYANMDEEGKFEFENMLKNDFASLYNDSIELFNEIKNNPELKTLLAYLGKHEVMVENFKIEQPEEVFKKLEEIENRCNKEFFKTLLRTIFNKSVILKEIKILAYKIQSEGLAIIDNYYDYLKYVYKDNYKEFFEKYEDRFVLFSSQEDLFIYCLRNRKKAFLKLITEESNLFDNLYSNSILFTEEFRKLINLNTLNSANLKEILSYSNYSKLFDIIKGKQILTFNEFKELNSCQDFMIKLYLNLDMRIDDKLKAISEIKNLTYLDLKMKDIPEDELINKLKNLIEQKIISRWIAEDFANIKRVKKESYLQLLLNKNAFKKFIPEIKDQNDIDFLMTIRNTEFLNMRNLNEAKYFYYRNSDNLNELLKQMKLSDKFKEENKDGIYRFAAKGLIPIVDTLINDLSTNQKNNLLLLTKAYMANQFEKVKFYNNDLDIEIGIKTSDNVKEEWKNNIKKTLKKGYYCEETYDFKTTLEMGVYPVSSCMHWGHGSYKQCLLSNFDTNKKLLIAGDDEGLIGRAVIRLTKGKENTKQNTETKLSFKDIEEIDKIEDIKTDDSKKQLILFLERPYIKGVTDEVREKILKTFVEIAIEKARKLNALLVLANESYDNALKNNALCFSEVNKKIFNIFISYSKNGLQYLDSFSGQNSAKMKVSILGIV